MRLLVIFAVMAGIALGSLATGRGRDANGDLRPGGKREAENAPCTTTHCGPGKRSVEAVKRAAEQGCHYIPGIPEPFCDKKRRAIKAADKARLAKRAAECAIGRCPYQDEDEDERLRNWYRNHHQDWNWPPTKPSVEAVKRAAEQGCHDPGSPEYQRQRCYHQLTRLTKRAAREARPECRWINGGYVCPWKRDATRDATRETREEDHTVHPPYAGDDFAAAFPVVYPSFNGLYDPYHFAPFAPRPVYPRVAKRMCDPLHENCVPGPRGYDAVDSRPVKRDCDPFEQGCDPFGKKREVAVAVEEVAHPDDPKCDPNVIDCGFTGPGFGWPDGDGR